MDNFNKLCDNMMLLLITHGNFVNTNTLYDHYKEQEQKVIDYAINRLLADNYVVNLSSSVPNKYIDLADAAIMITGRGYAFIQDAGYCALTNRILKERRKVQLDTFKIGWEMVVSVGSLAVSCFAVYYSLYN